MKSPQSFVRILGENWKLLSGLLTECRGQSFHQQVFFKAFRNEDPPAYTPELAHHKLELLVREGLLEPVPRASKEYEFARVLLTFIESLLNEQKLSLHSELIVRIDALNMHRERLETSIDEKDLAGYLNTCNEMDRLLRILKDQVDDSMHAVNRLVEEAKLFPKNLPLKTRYAKTLDAWDTFVNPVLEMSKPNTSFSQTITKIEQSLLDFISDESLATFLLESDYQRLVVIHGRLLDFQTVLLNAVENMGKRIYPIVQSVRLNTAVTRGATLAIRHLEKMNQKDWVSALGVGITKTRSIARHGNLESISSFMLAIRQNRMAEEEAPSLSNEEIKSKAKADRLHRTVSQHEVIRDMRKRLPLMDAITKIRDRYPDIDLKTLITSFAKLSRTEGFTVTRDDDRDITLEIDNKTISFKNRNIVSQ